MPTQNSKYYSAGLVAAQFVLIILICTRALPAKLSAFYLPGLVLIAIACVLAVAAVLSLQLRNLSVMPEPVNQGKLITNGPYRFIRHPMYSSVLLGCTGMFLLNITPISAVLLIALYAVLLFKIQREETLLINAYTGYNNYRKNTGALIPNLFKK